MTARERLEEKLAAHRAKLKAQARRRRLARNKANYHNTARGRAGIARRERQRLARIQKRMDRKMAKAKREAVLREARRLECLPPHPRDIREVLVERLAEILQRAS